MGDLQRSDSERKSNRKPEHDRRGVKSRRSKKKKEQHVNSVNMSKCFYTNSDSLLNKRLELEAAIVLYSPDIVCITEFSPKFTTTPVQEAELQIQGYDMFSNTGNHRRGVIIYTRKELQA